MNMTKAPKDYAYRSTWKHKFSRARNLAQRGGLTKKEMMKKYGRFPKKKNGGGSRVSHGARQRKKKQKRKQSTQSNQKSTGREK